MKFHNADLNFIYKNECQIFYGIILLIFVYSTLDLISNFIIYIHIGFDFS